VARRRDPKPTSWVPHPKVATVGLAGALTTVGVALVGSSPTPELTAAITTIVAFGVAYLIPAGPK